MRYFTCFYRGSNGNNWFWGNMSFSNKEYPSRAKLSESIKDVYGYVDVLIFNIDELTQQDYNNWIK